MGFECVSVPCVQCMDTSDISRKKNQFLNHFKAEKQMMSLNSLNDLDDIAELKSVGVFREEKTTAPVVLH